MHADPGAIAHAFAAIAELEPVAWVAGGVECAPLAGGRDPIEQARRLAAFGLPWDEVPGASPPLPFPAAVGGGVYRRALGHAPAPDDLPEVVLVTGEGFGLAEHPTTGMCLNLLELLPDGPVLDAGCGSGTLALVWARLGRGTALAVDVDPRAVAQARKSAAASGLADSVECRRVALDHLDPADITGRVVLANAPRPAQDALLAVCGNDGPRALMISGLRPDGMAEVLAAWTVRGYDVVRCEQVGRWKCAVLLPT